MTGLEVILMMESPSSESARENLMYIRKTLEAAVQLTAVPGKCLMIAGLLALGGVCFNLVYTGAPWIYGPKQQLALETWGVVLAVSLAAVSYGICLKSRQMRTPIQPLLVRKLLWNLCPALLVGGLLTSLAVRTQSLEWLPPIWLGCYGAAVTSGGQVSVTPVRYMGLCFLAAAGAAVYSPPGMGLTWLAVGFGWLHLVFGAFIAWRHNG
jgi:hypothetical protein